MKYGLGVLAAFSVTNTLFCIILYRLVQTVWRDGGVLKNLLYIGCIGLNFVATQKTLRILNLPFFLVMVSNHLAFVFILLSFTGILRYCLSMATYSRTVNFEH